MNIIYDITRAIDHLDKKTIFTLTSCDFDISILILKFKMIFYMICNHYDVGQHGQKICPKINNRKKKLFGEDRYRLR